MTMIESKVPKDIRVYETKAVGPLTLRQLICVLIAIVIDAIMIFAVMRPTGLSSDLAVYILIAMDVPIFVFLLKPGGMKFEKYVRCVLKDSFLKPKYRKYENIIVKKETYSVDDKKYQARAQKLAKKDPKYKPY